MRWRAIRRWSVPVLSLLILAVAMTSAIRRGGEARRISHDLDQLSASERVVREQLAAQVWRADSLASRGRITEAAADLGLRPARDHEITFLREVEAPSE